MTLIVNKKFLSVFQRAICSSHYIMRNNKHDIISIIKEGIIKQDIKPL